MIRLGKVKDNKMVDMQISSDKLIERGTRITMSMTSIKHNKAKALLLGKKGDKKVIESSNNKEE